MRDVPNLNSISYNNKRIHEKNNGKVLIVFYEKRN